MPRGPKPPFVGYRTARHGPRGAIRRRMAAALSVGIGLGMGFGTGLAGCASTRSAPTPAAEMPVEPGTYLPDFDRAWELVRDTFHEETYNGVDWEAVRVELRPQAEAATTRAESRDIINGMVARLNQSHFGIIPEELQNAETEIAASDDDGSETPAEVASDSEDGGVGFDVRVADERAVVTRVTPGGPADGAGVRPGWLLTAINGSEVAPLITRFDESIGSRTGALYAWQSITRGLNGPVGTQARLAFLDGADRKVTRTVERVEPDGQTVKFGNLPPIKVTFESRWLTPEETGGGDARIGYIAFNSFMIAITPDFERAMVAFKDADGVVIDLRGNLGGVAPMCASLSRFFVSERSRIGTMKMRGQDLQFNADPVVVTSGGERLGPFTGPLAILIDEGSASTAEFMAGGLRGLGRARTFGTRTAGMALPAAMSALPSGDVLLHAVADYVNSDGTRLESDGVGPDERVPVDRDALLRGVDAPLRAAADWIAGAGTGA